MSVRATRVETREKEILNFFQFFTIAMRQSFLCAKKIYHKLMLKHHKHKFRVRIYRIDYNSQNVREFKNEESV